MIHRKKLTNICFIFLAGIMLGTLITVDPFLSNTLTRRFDINLHGVNILKIYPFLLTSFIFFSVISISWGYLKFGKYLFEKKEKILLYLIIASPQFGALSFGFLELMDIFILFFISLWSIEVIREKRFILNTPIHLLFYLFIFAVVLSSINGGILNLFLAIRLLKSILYAFILMILIKNKDDILQAFKGLFIVTSVSSVIAIVQEILFLGLGLVFVGNVSPDAKDLMFQDTSFGIILRTPAFLGYPQALSRVLCLVMTLLFLCLFEPKMKDYFNRRYYSLFLIVIGIAMFLTYSRPSWISVAIGLMIGIYLKRPSYLIHYAAATILLIIVAYNTGLIEEFKEVVYKEIYLGGDFSDRLDLAREGLEKIGRHPLIGAGLNRSSRYTPNVHNWPVHNGFLFAFVSTGILGFAGFCFSFIYIYLRLINIVIDKKEALLGVLGLYLISGLSAYLFDIQFMPAFIDSVYFIYILALNASVISIYNHYRSAS